MSVQRWLFGFTFLGLACTQPPRSDLSGLPDSPIAAVNHPTMKPDTPPDVDTMKLWDVTVATLTGRISPESDTGFARVGAPYTTKSDLFLRKSALEAFKEMHAAAEADGIKLTILSATRPFAHQKRIWESKWTGKTLVEGKSLATSHPNPEKRALKILEYSSMPGTSRHHWGTDIDLNSLENAYFASGEGKRIYDWLVAHAPSYGFCQTYTEMGESRPEGYFEEKWHWSYLPISSRFLEQYLEKVSYSDIEGFQGAEVAEPLKVIPRFVGGISPACKSK